MTVTIGRRVDRGPAHPTAGPGTRRSPGPSSDPTIRALIAAHESERRQIASDLHDVVGQALTAIRLHLESIRKASMPGLPSNGLDELEEAVVLIDATLRQVRDLAFEIRPALLDDLGLAVAARASVARQARIAGFVADFAAETPLPRLAPDTEAACYRTLQEAITNVSRHSGASAVDVRLTVVDDELELVVADDGVGFLPGPILRGEVSTRPSLGLRGMRERVALAGGNLTIDSAPGRGTLLRATFPVRVAARTDR